MNLYQFLILKYILLYNLQVGFSKSPSRIRALSGSAAASSSSAVCSASHSEPSRCGRPGATRSVSARDAPVSPVAELLVLRSRTTKKALPTLILRLLTTSNSARTGHPDWTGSASSPVWPLQRPLLLQLLLLVDPRLNRLVAAKRMTKSAERPETTTREQMMRQEATKRLLREERAIHRDFRQRVLSEYTRIKPLQNSYVTPLPGLHH